jgi:eukaryotic-like serine/threonine-protein kinase
MSLWKKLFRRGDKADPEEVDATSEPPEPPGEHVERSNDDDDDAAKRRDTQLLRLRRVGRRGGYEVADAIAVLRGHEGRPEQSDDLHALVEGLEAPGVAGLPLDALRVACATLLDDRGRRADALRLVAGGRSVAAMMMAAELHAAEGDLPKAVSMVERVLARAIDTPGARERHERWSGQLGRRKVELDDGGATTVAPTMDKTTFRLTREVARGGSGAVYEAEDELLGRRLAYKVYHRAQDDQAAARRRAGIEREARLAIRLAGPGVLRIYDADASNGWLAMEWLPGGSLRDLLKQGRIDELLPLDRWLPKLLSAVARVHDEGLVHSDLKPANILFRGQHEPVLSDFGACQLAGEQALAGTPGYMSPERIDDDHLDSRDDVYALGRIIEDVLGARDDAEGDDAHEADARRWAAVGLACLASGESRPAHARAVLELAAGVPVASLPGQEPESAED